jgi:chromosome segregation ATPase
MKLAFLLASMPFLFEEANENPSAGGAAPPANDPPKADDDTKLTIGQRLSAAIASKASLQAEIADLKGQLATAESAFESNQQTFQSMSEQLNQANAKIATLEADAAEVDKALKTAEAEAAGLKATEKTVEKKAQELTSQLGFSAAKLPAADDVDPDDAVPSSRAELEAAMDKLPTAQERAALLDRYNKASAAA